MSYYNAFVYFWTNLTTGRQYIGSHKGKIDDGYISSSKFFNEDYNKTPKNFKRSIVSLCENYEIARKQEAALCLRINVKSDPMFYNMHNGDGSFVCKGHSSAARKKIAKSNRGKKRPEMSQKMLGTGNHFYGKKHTKATKYKISELNKKRILSEETKKKISNNHHSKQPGFVSHLKGKPAWNKGKKIGTHGCY